MTDIEFDFNVLAMGALIDDWIERDCPPPRKTRSEFSLERELRGQIDRVTYACYHGVDRIRIVDMPPSGMMLRVPYEKDGSTPSPHRRTDDAGPQEILVNPDDWEAIIAPYRERSSACLPPGTADTAYAFRLREGSWYAGIPVIDDTLQTRMRERP